MSRILRAILGLSVVIALFPVVTNALSGEVDTKAVDANSSALDPFFSEEPGADVDTQPTPNPGSQRESLVAEAQTGNPRTSTEDPTGTTPTEQLDPTTPTSASQTSTTTGASSPTTAQRSTTTQQKAGQASGTITGDVCPCTVTGTVELVGDINLKGDLIVDGGTLVARPGVNVTGNGYQIMFVKGGKADFQGTPVFTWSGDGSNANIERDINFSGLRRLIFTDGAATSILRYFRVDNSGTSNPGDFVIHFHRNGNATSGTIVEGVVVTNAKNHAFVPHGSHGITFKETIAKNVQCDAYWWNPPDFQSTSTINNSNNIVYDRALADGVTSCAGDDRGFRLSAFFLGAGTGNVVKNSVARNVRPSSPKDCAGFHWPELSEKQPGSWRFENNASYGSACHGIFVWQNNSAVHVINGFRGDGISNGAYINQFEYNNVKVDYVQIHALGGWSVTGGSIGRVEALKHNIEGEPVTFTDVAISEFIVDNARNGGTVPGHYVLTGTGLTCEDITYKSVVPGTIITIDGSDC